MYIFMVRTYGKTIKKKNNTHNILYDIYYIYTCTYIHICINVYFIRSVYESRLYKRQKTYEVVHHTHIHRYFFSIYIYYINIFYTFIIKNYDKRFKIFISRTVATDLIFHSLIELALVYYVHVLLTLSTCYSYMGIN